jgi:hypothetical protein
MGRNKDGKGGEMAVKQGQKWCRNENGNGREIRTQMAPK